MKKAIMGSLLLLLLAPVARAGSADLLNRALSASLQEHADVQRDYKANASQNSATEKARGAGEDPIKLDISVDGGSAPAEGGGSIASSSEPPVQDELSASERTGAKLKRSKGARVPNSVEADPVDAAL